MRIDDLIAEAQREAMIRARVYPKWYRAGKLSRTDMDHRIACMDEIVHILRLIADRHMKDPRQ